MKEIDFLPEWYKSGKRRQISYRKQYIVLASVLMVMVVWNFITARSISEAQAQFVSMETRQAEAKNLSIQLEELKGKLKVIQEKAKIVEKIDSRIDVANVLAEMSFLIDETIVLSKVEFIAEKFQDRQQGQQSSGSGTVVRAVRATLNDIQKMPLGDVRFKVVINGVAVDASDVAAFICKLEESPYFCQVVLSYSKNNEITARDNSSVRSKVESDNSSWNAQKFEGNKKIQVSEFEISSYLANYTEQ
jgi:Tfp pilus assembly protein PilN